MDEHEHEPTGANKMIPESRKTAAGENQHDRRDRRTQRIDDLTDQALEESDPLRANLKVAAAQLFDISYRLGDELQDNVSPRQAKPKTRRDAAGGVSTLMLVHRQITRYVQLDQQWVSEKNSANRTGAPSAAMDGQTEG